MAFTAFHPLSPPQCLTEGKVTENFNKTGVRLWT